MDAAVNARETPQNWTVLVGGEPVDLHHQRIRVRYRVTVDLELTTCLGEIDEFDMRAIRRSMPSTHEQLLTSIGEEVHRHLPGMITDVDLNDDGDQTVTLAENIELID